MRSRPTGGWALAAGTAMVLAVLATVPPVVGGELGHALHHAFGGICHQMPERSIHIGGHPIALCHRCSGILAGFIAGLLVAPLAVRQLTRLTTGSHGRWLLIAAIPTCVDWALGALGIWTNTPASRLLTGGLFGIVAGLVLAANLLALPKASPRLTHSSTHTHAE